MTYLKLDLICGILLFWVWMLEPIDHNTYFYICYVSVVISLAILVTFLSMYSIWEYIP